MKKLLLLFLIPFCFADVEIGRSTGEFYSDPAHISVGSHPVQQIDIYTGGQLRKVWEDLETPTITTFSVSPNSIDLDTRLTGTITFTIAVTGTPTTTGSTPSTLVFVAQTTRGGNWFQNSIASSGYSLKGTRTRASSNLLALDFHNSQYTSNTALRNFYTFHWLKSFTDTKTPASVTIEGNSYSLRYVTQFTQSGTTITTYQTTNAVTRAGDQVSSGSGLTKQINFKFSDNSYLWSGPTGGNTYAQVVQLPGGQNIGPTQSSTGGSNISTTIPNINQPLQTTTYRLFVHNGAGASHKDTTVTVTKNPTISNCRRTGFIDSVTRYTFGFTLTGLPRPTVRYVFSGGQQGDVFLSHYTQGSNPYTWTIDGWNINFANANAQSLTLTATNSQGTATCRIANIND